MQNLLKMKDYGEKRTRKTKAPTNAQGEMRSAGISGAGIEAI